MHTNLLTLSKKGKAETEAEAPGKEEASFPTGIKTIYESASAAIVDIVFVHGLTGDRERTWTSKRGCNWTRTLLPSKVTLALPDVSPEICFEVCHQDNHVAISWH
jgi:hypothetical protein